MCLLGKQKALSPALANDTAVMARMRRREQCIEEINVTCLLVWPQALIDPILISMATNSTKSTNGANERHRRGRVVRAARGCSRRDRGNDQGRLAREGEVIVRSLLRDRLRPLRGGRLALGDEPSAQPSDHEGSRHAVEPCERNKKGLMVEPLRVHWIAPAGSVLRPRQAGSVSLGP